MDWITICVLFIDIYLISIFLLLIAWFIYLFCIILDLKEVLFFVLPEFLQKFLWKTPESIITNSKPIFVVVTLFLVIMYIFWLIIQLLIPEYILFIPIRKILSDIRPFPDLNNAGIFRLFDNIISLFTTKEKFLKKIGLSAKLVGDFLEDSTKYIKNLDYSNYENLENKEKNIDNKEKIDKVIESEKINCSMRDKKHITPDLNEFDKIKINIDNIKTDINCSINNIGSKIQQNIVL